jgi:hypothetical protein
MSLLTATGEASQFSGKVDLEIKLGVHVFKHEFLLARNSTTFRVSRICKTRNEIFLYFYTPFTEK